MNGLKAKRREILILAAMLLGFGLLTVSLIFAGYRARGEDFAMLIAAAAASISVPVAGMLALLAAWWQQNGTGDGQGSTSVENEAPKVSERGEAPLIDRSIVLIGNGYGHLTMEAGRDAFRLDTFSSSDDRPAPPVAAGGSGEQGAGSKPVTR